MTVKYKEIENFFINSINKGNFKVGEQLPPELKITEDTGYSRMTINKALNNLEKQGYVTRISGRGTFVKAKNIVRMINDNISFTEILQRQGMTPGATLISYELLDVANLDPENSERLGEKITKLHHFKRLRTGDGKPMAISDDYLDASLVEKLNLDLLSPSLYTYLKRLKLPVIQNFVEIKAVKATKEQEKILDLKDDFLLKTVANVDTITMDNERQQLGIFGSYYNPRLYTYRFNNPESPEYS